MLTKRSASAATDRDEAFSGIGSAESRSALPQQKKFFTAAAIASPINERIALAEESYLPWF
jgi:hypothetical protein